MYRNIVWSTLLALVVILLLTSGVVLAATMSSPNYSLSWFTLAGSGSSMASSNYSAHFTVGQTASGSASSNNYQIGLGFWPSTSRGGGNIYLPIIIKGS